jgi:hypothetical protein
MWALIRPLIPRLAEAEQVRPRVMAIVDPENWTIG